MDDEEDLKRMIEVLNNSKQGKREDIDFDDIIDSGCSDGENDFANDEVLLDDEFFSNIETFDVFDIYKHDPISSLKPEEKHLIDTCVDEELKHLLFLNRRKNINLILLYKKLQDLLMECRQYIIEKSSLLKEHINTLKLNHQSGGAWRLGAPYFKDKQLYQSPQNEDTKRKKKNNELFVYDLGAIVKWSSYECEKVIKAVKLNYNFNQQQFKKGEIKDANKNGLDKFKKKEDENTLKIPPLGSNDFINWSRIATVFINDKRSECECQSIWQLYLHPSINKSQWTSDENEKLKTIVKKYKRRNWEQIALELGTNRSELTVCKHYVSNLSQKYKRGEFTYEEDKKLLDTINKYKIGTFIQWNKVAKHFSNRTRGQIHHRYTYYLSQDTKKRGKFTKAEDILLMICVDKFGKNFKKCAEFIPERSMVQCKSRYGSNLQRTILKGNWTVEDDERIMAHVKEHGPILWTRLAKSMLRSRGQLRQRYLRIQSHLDAGSVAEVSNVPRRGKSVIGQKRYDDGDYELCRSIANRFNDKNKIPKLKEIQRILKTENIKDIGSSDEDESDEDDTEPQEQNLPLLLTELSDIKHKNQLEELLHDFFSNSYKMPRIKVISPSEFENAVEDIERILSILNVNLSIPEDLEDNEQLDNLDVKILTKLSSGPRHQFDIITTEDKCNNINELVPPNLYSTVGLRSLLIKHLHFKNKEKSIMGLASTTRNQFLQLRQSVTNDILNFMLTERTEIEGERNLFYRRFHSLFKWPALMTLQNPKDELLNMSEFLPKSKHTQVKRTYSRVSCNTSNDDPKKFKPTVSIPSSTNVLKLTPITNKSVIQDLIKNKSKKLFSFNKVDDNGQVKTVINEIKLEFGRKNAVKKLSTSVNPSASSLKIITSSDSRNSTESYTAENRILKLPILADVEDLNLETIPVGEASKDDEDVYDLEKLNIFLKGENVSDSDSDIDVEMVSNNKLLL